MSIFNPYEYRGTVYKTPQEVKAAKRARSIEVIKNKIGFRGFVSNLILSDEQRRRITEQQW